MTVTPDYWEKAKTHLSKRDKIMKKIILSYTSEGLQRKHDAFITLARSITGQQISVKAASTIWGRMESELGDISTATIIGVNDSRLRDCGYSRQKISYLKHIAENFANGTISSEILMAKTEEEALKELIKLKGIGKWTAEMFLIFHMMKPDVFPIDDIGVQKAIRMHYIEQLPPGGGAGKTSVVPWGGNQYASYGKTLAQKMRTKPTDAEAKLWKYIKSKQLLGYKFRRQQPIGPFIVDFVCMELGLVVELDGGQHNEKSKKEYDQERTAFLEKSGFKVKRFWNNDVLKHTEEVIETIYNECKKMATRTPPHGSLRSPAPPPGGSSMTKEEMLKLAENWRPYRTVATWYLWRSLDPMPVEY